MTTRDLTGLTYRDLAGLTDLAFLAAAAGRLTTAVLTLNPSPGPARSEADGRNLKPPDPHGDAENTYDLPDGAGLAAELAAWFDRQKKAVLDAVPKADLKDATAAALLPPASWDGPMARAMVPHLSATWSKSGKEVMGRLGFDPSTFNVTSPRLKDAIHSAALKFCRATNRTTSLRVGAARDAVRAALQTGLVDEGEGVKALTERIRGIFRDATESRAKRIAATESSRAYHAAMSWAAHDSGVVAGLELLLSGDACPLCRKIASEAKRVRLGQAFAVVGTNPDYSTIKHPPLHPNCQCSLVEVLKPEYGGPEHPQWAATLAQPQEGLTGDYTPPPGVHEAAPQPDRPKPTPGPPTRPPVGYVPPPVEHPEVPDRVEKPGDRQALYPMPESTAEDPKPKPKPKPKPPAFPADPAALPVVQALGGSTGAKLVEDPATGRRYVRKQGTNPGHLTEETHADAVYRALGIAVPDSKRYDPPAGSGSGPVKLAAYVPGRTLKDLMTADPAAAAKATAELRKGFVADALLGNWDVVGQGFDNVLVGDDGKVYRIDNGGSLRYRAQGAKKGPSQWTGAVNELQTMRSAAVNPAAAKVFGPVTDAEIKAQAKAVVRKRAAILKALPAELHETVDARLDYLKTIAEAKAPKPPKPVAGFNPLPADLFRSFSGGEAEMKEWGKTHYGAWAKSLTAAERVAVRYYTGSGYRELNRGLRRGTADADESKTVQTLNGALKRAKLPEGIVVRRGIHSLGEMGLSRETIAPGMRISDPAFVSTTTRPAPSFGSGLKFEIRLPAGAPGAWVNAAGKDSSHPHEWEFLLPAGSGNFHVVSHRVEGATDHVVLQWAPK